MILPGPKDIEFFQTFETADFVRWLRVGLEGYFLEGRGVWAFEHLGVFLGREDHLELDLSNVYRLFPAQKKARFRQAVADLMAVLEADARCVPLFESLLTLAAALPAPEILSVIPTRVGNGFFGRVRGSNGQTLFGQTVETVAELAVPTQEALNALHALLGSHQFESAYAGLTLVSLCRVNPEGFVQHMEYTRDKLTAMFRDFQSEDADKQRLARRIAKAVNLNVLRLSLEHLHYGDPTAIEPNDNWFLEALISGGIILFPPHREMIHISYADDPNMSMPLIAARNDLKPISWSVGSKKKIDTPLWEKMEIRKTFDTGEALFGSGFGVAVRTVMETVDP